MKGSTSDKLRRFFALFSSENRVLIPIQADPDSIASAMAVKRLLWRKTASITISNINVIKRPDNIAMVRLLDVKLIQINKIDPKKYDRIVLVDSQPNHNDAFSMFTPQAIIDHHPYTGAKADYLDIRPSYGATASILTEYLRAAKIKPSIKLATGLFHAIKTDTSNFERKTLIEDIKAFQYLFRHANIHLAHKIEQCEISFDFLKYFNIALEKMRRRKGRIFTHVGTVTNPDACVVIADFFARVQTVTWTIVSGFYNEMLIIILRNDGLRKNAGSVASQCFGQYGSAGGHKSMARAEIPAAILKKEVDYRNEKKIMPWIINHIEKRAGKK